MMYLYFYLISFSLIGYGLFLGKILDIKIQSLGIYGILGITLISLLSFCGILAAGVPGLGENGKA